MKIMLFMKASKKYSSWTVTVSGERKVSLHSFFYGLVLSGLIEYGDHVFEVHTSAIKRRHREGEVGVAGFDRDRETLQVAKELRQIRSARARRETIVTSLVEDAIHVLRRSGR